MRLARRAPRRITGGTAGSPLSDLQQREPQRREVLPSRLPLRSAFSAPCPAWSPLVSPRQIKRMPSWRWLRNTRFRCHLRSRPRSSKKRATVQSAASTFPTPPNYALHPKKDQIQPAISPTVPHPAWSTDIPTGYCSRPYTPAPCTAVFVSAANRLGQAENFSIHPPSPAPSLGLRSTPKSGR